jgi:hypothetical protein
MTGLLVVLPNYDSSSILDQKVRDQLNEILG